MSKITKLINNPKLFFIDALKKRKKPAQKKKPAQIFLTDNVNLLEPFTHLLHSGEGENGINHLNLWIPLFLESNVKFLVITRHLETYKNVKIQYPLLDVVFAKGRNEIKHIFDKLVFLQACFYPSNNGINIHPLEYNNIKHIFIGHGDSDKLTSAHKRFRVYDENWVAGDAHIDRFKNARFDCSGLKQVKVGRPNLIDFIKISEINWRIRFNNEINLLYLSTWEGSSEAQNYSSVHLAIEIFEEIFRLNYIDNYAYKLHPALGIRSQEKKSINYKLSNAFEDKNINILEYTKNDLLSDFINKYNIFICDISAVVSECLSLDAPIFVYIPIDKEIKLSQSNMRFEDYTYTFSSSNELIEKLQKILNGNDYLKNNREKAMEYILGKSHIEKQSFINNIKKIRYDV